MATSSFDLHQTGLLFQQAGEEINDWISSNFAALDFHQVQELTNKSQDLLIKSKSLFALTAVTLSDDVKTSLQSLVAATTQIQTAIKNITKVQEVVNIATDLVSIAADVLTGNYGAIISSVEDIITSVSPSPAAP